MKLSWKISSTDPLRIQYFINSLLVGEDNNGFDKVLEQIKASRSKKVELIVKGAISLGGGCIEDSLPFKDRFKEFKTALGAKKLLYRMF
jgi:hypothetical protein